MPKDDAPEPDPELVKAMRSRVVRPKERSYENVKAGPGRPKGLPKSGGRKSGVPNTAPALRALIAEKAKPIEKLIRIASGTFTFGSGEEKRKPTPGEQLRAIQTLSSKCLPDITAVEVSGKDGEPLLPTPAPELTSLEMARRMLFILTRADQELDAEAALPLLPSAVETSVQAPSAPTPEPEPEEPLGPQVGDLVVEGTCKLTLAEVLSGGRER